MEFETFLDAELAGLGRFAGVLTGNRQDAHDVLVDALIKVSAAWRRIEPMEQRTAYVRRTIVNTFISQRRTSLRRRTDPYGDDAIFDSAISDASDAVADRDLTRSLLATLPPRQRAALVLRFYCDMDDTTVAETLGISVTNTRTTISRALARLRVVAVTVEASC